MNVNSQHDINGWTALHWAAKRNHLNIVNKLLNHGADKSIKTNKGEVPASLTQENVIKVLLSASVNTAPAPVKEEKLPITPNYIKNPVLAYKVETGSPKEKETPVVQEKRARLEAARPSPPLQRLGERYDPHYKCLDCLFRRQMVGAMGHEMILKVRVAGSDDPDYIEIELPGDSLTLESLVLTASTELEIEAGQVERVRRMPNTRLRRDKEVARLPDYQEIELVVRQ